MARQQSTVMCRIRHISSQLVKVSLIRKTEESNDIRIIIIKKNILDPKIVYAFITSSHTVTLESAVIKSMSFTNSCSYLKQTTVHGKNLCTFHQIRPKKLVDCVEKKKNHSQKKKGQHHS